jgi:hypothetical protein
MQGRLCALTSSGEQCVPDNLELLPVAPSANYPVYNHRIGGITFRTELDAPFPLFQAHRFQPFSVSNTIPDVRHRIRKVDLSHSMLPPPKDSEAEGLVHYMHDPPADLSNPLLCSAIVRDRIRVALDDPDRLGLEIRESSLTIFDFARCELDLFYIPGLGYDRYRAGASLFTPFLPIFSAAMIHSAAVVLDGAAALFLAPDEGGKTTIVRHALPGMTLCDDQNILRHEGAAILVHSTPLGLYTHGPRSAPLGGMFLVEQAESFELLPLNSLSERPPTGCAFQRIL